MYCHLELLAFFQADFDDGHCPSWSNQLRGLHNIYCFVHGSMTGKVPLVYYCSGQLISFELEHFPKCKIKLINL